MLAVTVLFCFLQLSRGSGDGMPTANFCTGSMTTFSDESSFLPGQNVTITCSLPSPFVIFNSPQFIESIVVSGNPSLGSPSGTRLNGAVVFTLTSVIAGPPPCTTATATIANIQESMEGLGLSCSDGSNMANFIIGVIDPPDPVTSLNLTQICNDVFAKWTAPANQSCPITGYSVNYTYPPISVVSITPVLTTNVSFHVSGSVCEKTFGVSVSAISAAGTSNATSSTITVTCTPTDISVVNISDTSALLKWNNDINVAMVVEYNVSVQSQADSVPINVPADSEVIMVTVGVDKFTDPKLFIITSLEAEDYVCFTIESEFPAIKYDNVVEPASQMATVTFPFRHDVMEIVVSPSPVNTSCSSTITQMAVIISCSELTNGMGYTVTLRGTLSVEETLLPFTFSESFTPTAGTPAPTQSTTPPEGGHGNAVRLSISMTFIGALVLSSLITLLFTCM